MIQPAFEILNQRGTPMFFSDVFANRPTAGIVGRIFISTDTKEFYRDTGSTWELIGGPGSGTITGSGTAGTLPIWTSSSVLGNSSLLEGALRFTTTKVFQADAFYLNGMTAGSGALYWTSDRVTIANYNTGGSVLIEVNGGNFAQELRPNLDSYFYGNVLASQKVGINKSVPSVALDVVGRSYILDTATYSTGTIQSQTIDKQLTIPNGASISGSVSLTSQLVGGTTTFQGSTTIPNSTTLSNNLISNSFAFSGAGTILLTQAAGIRAASSNGIQTYFSGTSSSTISHYAANFIYGFYNINSGSITPVIQNAYMLLINDMNDYSHTFTFNNRWGIYQAGANDVNYFAANILINTQVNSGEKLRVNGNVLIEAKVTANDSLLNTSYTGGGTAIIETWQRIGGAVAANMVYDDANTNINFGTSTSHDFNIKTSNTSRITIKSSGIVGIGTSSPSELLNILGTGDTKLLVETTKIGTDGNSALQLKTASDGNWIVQAGNAVSGGLRFVQVGFGEIGRFSSSGNLLVGTSVDSGYKCQIIGTIRTEQYRIYPNGSNPLYNIVDSTDSYTGSYIFQAGGGSAGFGGSIIAYGHSHATKPGWITAGISVNSGGKFSVNSNAMGTATEVFTVDAQGLVTINGQRSGTAGGNSGQHLIINCDGTTYKIALLNP